MTVGVGVMANVTESAPDVTVCTVSGVMEPLAPADGVIVNSVGASGSMTANTEKDEVSPKTTELTVSTEVVISTQLLPA